MRGFQCILLCALLYSISVDAFGSCSGSDDDSAGVCPDNAECSDSTECECKEGYDEIDLPDITIGGEAATVCIDLGICSPFDNKVEDCGENGQCVIFQDNYGYKAVCKCDYGYYGKFCDELTTSSSTPYSTKGTTKKFTPWVLLGGGAILLAVLAGGAAAVASSSSG